MTPPTSTPLEVWEDPAAASPPPVAAGKSWPLACALSVPFWVLVAVLWVVS